MSIRSDSAEAVLMIVMLSPVSVTLEDLELCLSRSSRVGHAMLEGLFRPGKLFNPGFGRAVTQADIGLVPITCYCAPEDGDPGVLRWFEGNRKAVVQAKYCPLSFLQSERAMIALAHAENEEVFEAELCEAMLQQAFEDARWVYVADVSCAILWPVMFSTAGVSARSGLSGGSLWVYIVPLFLLSFKDVAEDVCVVRHLAKRGRRMDMLGDFLREALEAAALVILATVPSADGFDEVSIPSKTILAACAATSWLHALWELRALRVLGPRMLPILYAMYDTKEFCFVLIVSVCAAATSYLWLGVREGPGSIVENSFTLAYRLLVTGDFDQFEIQGTDPWYDTIENAMYPQDPSPTDAHYVVLAFFYLCTLFGSVGLMNIFIGVLGGNYERHEDRSRSHFLSSRATVLAHYTLIPWKRFFTVKDREGCELWMISRKTEEVNDNERSFRTFMKQLHKSSMEMLLQKLKNEILKPS